MWETRVPLNTWQVSHSTWADVWAGAAWVASWAKLLPTKRTATRSSSPEYLLSLEPNTTESPEKTPLIPSQARDYRLFPKNFKLLCRERVIYFWPNQRQWSEIKVSAQVKISCLRSSFIFSRVLRIKDNLGLFFSTPMCRLTNRQYKPSTTLHQSPFL